RITEAAHASDFVAPRTETESQVAAVWRDTLRVERVGALDNFFECGGHSLLATQLVGRLRSAFQIDLPLVALFDHPTVEELAAFIEGSRGDSNAGDELPLVAVPRSGDIPLSSAQQRLWFLDQLNPGSAAYNVPAALHLEGRLDAAALERAFGEIVRRHEVL